MTEAGRVAQIRVFPVKSLAGVQVDAIGVGPDGLVGDRAQTVVDAEGRPIRAKDAPALATLDPDTDDDALSAAVGHPVHLAALPPQPGVAPVHLVSRQAIDRATLGDVPEGCSADDPRANLVLDLEDDERGDERTWVGRTLHIGDVVLEVTRTPKHCLGVYAEVRRAGTIAAGDAVRI